MPGVMSEVMLGFISGVMPGVMPGVVSGVMPGVMPGVVFGVMSGVSCHRENVPNIAYNLPCVEELVFREDDITRNFEFLRPRMIDLIDPPRLISDEKAHHRFLVELFATRFLVDVAIDFASPFSNVLN